MASNTENLNLLMKNPSTDGADTFNVQTMLNENWQKIDNNAGTVAQTLANILKPTTPPIIGLPPSTTPDGMFQALGNTGELHVWRKTVKNAEDIPAGYTLGDVQTNINIFSGGRDSQSILYYNDTPIVDDAGNVTANDGTGNKQYAFYANSNYNVAAYMVGKYIEIKVNVGGGNTALDGVWFVPSDATVTVKSYKIYVSKIQKVTGYPLTPAGTTTTYPVSTNPKAYQEGSNGRDAGYALSDEKTGKFQLSKSRNDYVLFRYSDTVSVATDGTLSLNNYSSCQLLNDSPQSYASNLIGKFIMPSNGEATPPSPFTIGTIYYIPPNATLSNDTYWYVNKYQEVTGYAAIPAGTTIEYLGKLGDKARVQVVSYVGTGTYGKNNPIRISVPFKIKAIYLLGYYSSPYGNYPPYSSNMRPFVAMDSLTSEYRQYYGLSQSTSGEYLYGRSENGGKTFSWYNTIGEDCNGSGSHYVFLVIG